MKCKHKNEKEKNFNDMENESKKKYLLHVYACVYVTVWVKIRKSCDKSQTQIICIWVCLHTSLLGLVYIILSYCCCCCCCKQILFFLYICVYRATQSAIQNKLFFIQFRIGTVIIYIKKRFSLLSLQKFLCELSAVNSRIRILEAKPPVDILVNLCM